MWGGTSDSLADPLGPGTSKATRVEVLRRYSNRPDLRRVGKCWDGKPRHWTVGIVKGIDRREDDATQPVAGLCHRSAQLTRGSIMRATVKTTLITAVAAAAAV